MNTSSPTARLISLTLLALLLFMPPVLLLFDRPIGLGFSALPIYLFVSWLGVVLGAAWILERNDGA